VPDPQTQGTPAETSPPRGRRGLARERMALLRRDALETLSFYRRAAARRAAASELRQCTSTADLFRFTQAHFARPPAQNASELVRFVDTVSAIGPRTVCEIGVQDGGTNFILSRALATVDTMIGVDLHVSLKCQLRYFRRPDLCLRLIDGSSHAARTRRRVADALNGRPLDLLFIDGDHSHAGSVRDFLTYRDFVRPGGIIAFHDIVPDTYTRHGVGTAGYAGDVPFVWSELSSYYRSEEFIDDIDQDGAGIGVLFYDPRVSAVDDLPVVRSVASPLP